MKKYYQEGINFNWGIFLLMILLTFACEDSSSPVGPASGESSLEKVTVNYIESPIPVKWRGKTILAYELQVKNFEDSGYEVSRVDLLAGSNEGNVIKSYTGEELDLIYQAYSDTHIATGAVLYLWPEFNSSVDVPDTLYHKIYFTSASGNEVIKEGNKVPVSKLNPILIAPPVKGENWWWAAGPSNLDAHHRRSLMTFQSRAFISQRFAVDLIRFQNNGYYLDPTKPLEEVANNTIYCYGDTLYAVADGRVFNARDGLPDLQPGTMPELNIDNADGNYVVLEIEYNNGVSLDTVYANYAHLQTGSLMVTIGQLVHKGEPIGLLGNSGNTSGPHLHFHIQKKGYGILLSQGVPYEIENFHLKGIIHNAEELEYEIVPWDLENLDSDCTNEMPAMNYMVDF